MSGARGSRDLSTSRPSRILYVLLLGLAIVPSAGFARSDLVVLDLRANGVPDDLAAALTMVLTSSAQELTDLSLLGAAEVREVMSFQQARYVLAMCDSIEGCLDGLRDKLDPEFVLGGDVGQVGSATVLALRITRVRARNEVVARATTTVSGDDEALFHAVRALAGGLFRDFHVAIGRQVLRSSGTFRGEVRDLSDGRSVEGATLRLALPGVGPLTTDRYGRFRFAYSGPELRADVSVEAPGYVSRVVNLRLNDDGFLDLVLVAPAPRHYRAVLVGAQDRRPLAGARIHVLNTRAVRVLEERTGHDGVFTLVVQGHDRVVRVKASRGGFVDREWVLPLADELEVGELALAEDRGRYELGLGGAMMVAAQGGVTFSCVEAEPGVRTGCRSFSLPGREVWWPALRLDMKMQWRHLGFGTTIGFSAPRLDPIPSRLLLIETRMALVGQLPAGDWLPFAEIGGFMFTLADFSGIVKPHVLFGPTVALGLRLYHLPVVVPHLKVEYGWHRDLAMVTAALGASFGLRFGDD